MLTSITKFCILMSVLIIMILINIWTAKMSLTALFWKPFSLFRRRRVPKQKRSKMDDLEKLLKNASSNRGSQGRRQRNYFLLQIFYLSLCKKGREVFAHFSMFRKYSKCYLSICRSFLFCWPTWKAKFRLYELLPRMQRYVTHFRFLGTYNWIDACMEN